MFSFFRKKPAATPAPAPAATAAPAAAPSSSGGLIGTAVGQALEVPVAPVAPERMGWMDRLTQGLRKTGSSLTEVFSGAQIDDAFFEELETALLMADTGVKATQHLISEVKRRVAQSGASRPVQAKNILVDSLTQLLKPLEQPLVNGEHAPTVIMVAGVNGAGKTTSIGKLTKHLADAGESVLLAAAVFFCVVVCVLFVVWV